MTIIRTAIGRAGAEGRAEGKRRTEKGDKNEFGSQDRQEVPNSRERIAKKMAKLV